MLFIAHLSRRLRMSYCDLLPQSVRPSTPLNVFSSETPEPVVFNFHVGPSVKRRVGVENLYKWSRSFNQDTHLW